jgi:hypothetical protein
MSETFHDLYGTYCVVRVREATENLAPKYPNDPRFYAASKFRMTNGEWRIYDGSVGVQAA